MNHDDRIHRHLSRQADAIPLTAADPGSVMRRGARRRNRRRGAVVALAALAVVTTSVSVIGRDGPDATVDSDLAASVVPSPYDWTVVSPRSGLGFGGSSAVVDGTVYSLSSAPGPGTDQPSTGPHLYRSDDGAEWTEVPLPEGVRLSSLAGAEGALYALGTAPAGGGTGRDVVMSTSDDGAATWTNVVLPGDISALEARHPDQITLSTPSIVAADSTHLVVSIVVTATPDVAALLPGVDISGGWEIRPDGLRVYEPDDQDGSCGPPGIRCAGSPSTSEAPSSDGGSGDGGTITAAEDPGSTTTSPLVAGTYTWDELGLDPELQELIGGRTYLYTTDDGADFQRAELPAGVQGWGGQVLATPDGYRLFLGVIGDRDESTTAVLSSSDGYTWTEAGTVPGAPQAVGLVGDRPALSVWAADGEAVFVNQIDGTWASLGLSAAVDQPTRVFDVAFGPLGLAALVQTLGDDPQYFVVHTDGARLSAVALADHFDGRTAFIGVAVSADAILVRVDDPPDGDPSTPPTQRVLVGTPR